MEHYNGVTAAAMEAVAAVVFAVVATAPGFLGLAAVAAMAAAKSERKPFPQGRSRPALTARDSSPTFLVGIVDPNLFQGRAPLGYVLGMPAARETGARGAEDLRNESFIKIQENRQP